MVAAGVKLKPPAGCDCTCLLSLILRPPAACSKSNVGSALSSAFLASLISSSVPVLPPFSAEVTLMLRSKRGRELIDVRRASARTERAGAPFDMGAGAGADAEALGAATG